jgi:hypothetical protein
MDSAVIERSETNTNKASCNSHIDDVDMTDVLNNEFYQNINNPEKIVTSSFEFFLKNSNASVKIDRKTFSEWNFVKDLQERNGVNLESEETLSKIPYLGSVFNNLKGGRLVKFNCMIQNILENQLYLALGKDKSQNNKYVINKYFEYENNLMTVEDDDLFGNNYYDADTSENILMDRLCLNCVCIPGLSPVSLKKFEICEESLKNLANKKIIVFDYDNTQFKVNQEILVIGVAYEVENTIVIHSWKIVQNYFKYLCSRNYLNLWTLSSFNFVSARNLVQEYLKLILNEDELLAEYLNMFLVSQIFYRLETKLIGKLLINIINQKENSYDYYTVLQNFFSLITNFSKTFNITIDSLNKRYLYPRFDINTEELIQGEFQTVDHTFVLLDERNLKEGKLNENGCKNFNTIKSLIDFQSINYYYPYNTIEIHHESQIVTVTDVCKSMFSSSELLEIPFLNGISSGYNADEHKKKIDKYYSTISDRDVEFMRRYVEVCRYSEEFVKNFKIDDELCKTIQNDFIDRRDENFSGDDLDVCMKIARLNAISNGRSQLSLDDYAYARGSEIKRKNRIKELKKK